MHSLLIAIFGLGYAAIILEYYIKINKTAVALFLAVVCWTINFMHGGDLPGLSHYLADIAQIIFFLLGAMTLVELIDAHKGFKFITDLIRTRSKAKMLWVIALLAFFLSSVLDNLTTTILMVSLLRKIIPERSERLLPACLVAVAANAGGAWTPIGDVTTTMLWINGQISSLKTVANLFLPSVVSLLIPVIIFTWKEKGRYPLKEETTESAPEPGAKLIFSLGVGTLIFVPILKALTGLPPYMGILIGLSVLWVVTDLLHHKFQQRHHLRVPAILTKIDTAGILFFLGILLSVSALDSAQILAQFAIWLDQTIPNQVAIATLIGVISAVIDNVPLVAASMGMYPLSQYPMDSSLWQMIAYAAGTGGSLLVIGSSSGVALMGLEKIDFITYARKMTLPVFVGFLAGMGVYLLQKIMA